MRKSTIFASFKIWKGPSGQMTDSAITPNVGQVFNLPALRCTNSGYDLRPET